MPSRIRKERCTGKDLFQTVDIGKPKAFSFDYGKVWSKIYGETRVVGRNLSFETFYDEEALLSKETFTLSKMIDN